MSNCCCCIVPGPRVLSCCSVKGGPWSSSLVEGGCFLSLLQVLGTDMGGLGWADIQEGCDVMLSLIGEVAFCGAVGKVELSASKVEGNAAVGEVDKVGMAIGVLLERKIVGLVPVRIMSSDVGGEEEICRIFTGGLSSSKVMSVSKYMSIYPKLLYIHGVGRRSSR